MVRVKICGIRRLEHALVAAASGADAIGLNFWRPGRRYVAPETARVIARSLPPFVARVGVFVDEEASTINRIADLVGLDLLQFHGDESPEFCRQFTLPVIKSVKVRSPESLKGLDRYPVSAFLLDTHVPGEAGGTGRRFDWSLAIPVKTVGPVILSGGLTVDNVAEAIRAAEPYAVDVASGVETGGEKDPDKIRAFIARVQALNAAEVRR